MIDLFTAPTPNGWKASIMLEEIGIPYTVHLIRLQDGQQREPWYCASIRTAHSSEEMKRWIERFRETGA